MSALSVITLGCRLNHAESARLAVALDGRRDTVLVNTCAVTAQAVRHSRRAIRQARGHGMRVIATGCAATIDPTGFAALADEVILNADKPGWTLNPSPSGEGLGWGLSSGRSVTGETPPPAPPLKGRGEPRAGHPSPSGEGMGVGAVRLAWNMGRAPTPTPPLKGRGLRCANRVYPR